MIEIPRRKNSIISESIGAKWNCGSYRIDKQKIEKDKQKLEEIREESSSRVIREELRIAKNRLSRFDAISETKVRIEPIGNHLEEIDEQVDCDWLRRRNLAAPKEIKMCSWTSRMIPRYFYLPGYSMIVVDHSELADAIAFEYDYNDTGITPEELREYTKEASLLNINDSKIVTNMIRTEMQLANSRVNGNYSEIHAGDAFELIRELEISRNCMNIQVSYQNIFSFTGNKVPISFAKQKRDKYDRVLDVSVHEVMYTIIDKAFEPKDVNKIDPRLLGFTERIQMVILVKDNVNIGKLKEDFTVVTQITGKKYAFIPKLLLYHSDKDEFLEV